MILKLVTCCVYFRQAALKAAVNAPAIRDKISRSVQQKDVYPHVYDFQAQAKLMAGNKLILECFVCWLAMH